MQRRLHCRWPFLLSKNVPSVNELIASFLVGFCARYFRVTSGSPSRIMRCTMIRLLKTIVHVESRRRLVRARKISATPASPAWVATRMCSTYFDFGAASCVYALACRRGQLRRMRCASFRRTRRYLYLRPALHALLEGACHEAWRVLQPGLPGAAGDVEVCWVVAGGQAGCGGAPLGLSQHSGTAK